MMTPVIRMMIQVFVTMTPLIRMMSPVFYDDDAAYSDKDGAF